MSWSSTRPGPPQPVAPGFSKLESEAAWRKQAGSAREGQGDTGDGLGTAGGPRQSGWEEVGSRETGGTWRCDDRVDKMKVREGVREGKKEVYRKVGSVVGGKPGDCACKENISRRRK